MHPVYKSMVCSHVDHFVVCSYIGQFFVGLYPLWSWAVALHHGEDTICYILPLLHRPVCFSTDQFLCDFIHCVAGLLHCIMVKTPSLRFCHCIPCVRKFATIHQHATKYRPVFVELFSLLHHIMAKTLSVTRLGAARAVASASL